MAEAVRSRQYEVLVFALDDQRYALWAGEVRELLRAVAIVPLPGAPGVVEGVIDLRGQIVPVLDVRRRFGLPAREVDPADHLIIAAVASRLVAIRVDHALDLLPLDVATLEEVSPLAAGTAHVAGVARLRDGLALIHDLETFFSAGETAALDRALAAAAVGAPA
jgi:purine-binding chemotaxis protein CheW